MPEVWFILKQGMMVLQKPIRLRFKTNKFKVNSKMWDYFFQKTPSRLLRSYNMFRVQRNKRNKYEYHFFKNLWDRKKMDKSQLVVVMSFWGGVVHSRYNNNMVKYSNASQLVRELLDANTKYERISAAKNALGVYGVIRVAGKVPDIGHKMDLDSKCLRRLIDAKKLSETIKMHGLQKDQEAHSVLRDDDTEDKDLKIAAIHTLRDDPIIRNKIKDKCSEDVNRKFENGNYYEMNEQDIDSIFQTMMTDGEKNNKFSLIKSYIPQRSCGVYKKKKKLGSGLYGSAYIVEKGEGKDKMEYVLKTQKSCYAFDREIRSLAKLRETDLVPKVVDSYVCLGTITNTYAIVMDKLDGTLLDLLYKVIEREDLAVNIARQLKDGCITLNEHGIFHNDISLLNIMYKEENNDFKIQFIDFGLAESEKDTSEPRKTRLIYHLYLSRVKKIENFLNHKMLFDPQIHKPVPLLYAVSKGLLDQNDLDDMKSFYASTMLLELRYKRLISKFKEIQLSFAEDYLDWLHEKKIIKKDSWDLTMLTSGKYKVSLKELLGSEAEQRVQLT